MDLTGAISITKLIMKCLAKAMDEVFTEEMGEDWFVTFCEEDKTYPDWQRICQFNAKRGRYPKDVTEFDFQAYIKILSFRDTYTDLLFKHYPISTSSDPALVEKERERLRALLTRLRKDFRNASFAHITLEDVLEEEQVSSVQTLYSYDEVVQDIKTLARIFRKVTDEQGHSYYDLIVEQLAKEMLDASSPTQRRYDMQVICRKERLNISAQQLYRYCVALDMTVHVDGGKMLLVTDNYGASIRRIRERLMLEKAQKTSNKSRAGTVLMSVVAVIAVVLLVGVSGLFLGKELVIDPLLSIGDSGQSNNAGNHSTSSTTVAITKEALEALPHIDGVDWEQEIEKLRGSKAHKTVYHTQTVTDYMDDVKAGWQVYSGDPSMQVVNEDGTVKASHLGTAYIICVKFETDGTVKYKVHKIQYL